MISRVMSPIAVVLLLLACQDTDREASKAREARAEDAGFTGQGTARGSRGTPGSASMGTVGAAAPASKGRSEAVSSSAPDVRADQSLPRTDYAREDSAVISSMLIRTGQASVEVDSVETGIARVRMLAQQMGGYVGNMSMQGGREQTHSAILELKIPAARFEQVVAGLRSIGKTEFVNTTAEDVGEEYVDIRARMSNSRRLEQRLIELLATRTGKLRDVLEVEQQLARVREQIERSEGRMRYLRTRAALSTLSVTVHEPLPIVGEYRGSSVLGAAFRQAWRNFVSFVAGFIALLGMLIPSGAFVAIAVWLGRKAWRSRRPRGGPSAGDPPASSRAA